MSVLTTFVHKVIAEMEYEIRKWKKIGKWGILQLSFNIFCLCGPDANISPALFLLLIPSSGQFIPYVGSLGWGSSREGIYVSKHFMFLTTHGLFSSWNSHWIRNSDWASLA